MRIRNFCEIIVPQHLAYRDAGLPDRILPARIDPVFPPVWAIVVADE